MARLILPIILALNLVGCGGGSDRFDAAPLPPDADLRPDAEPPPDASPPDAEPLLYDCDNLLAGPFVPIPVGNAVASEDIAFDADGHAVGADDYSIYKTEKEGMPEVFVANLQFRAGMRYLPTGDLVVANDQEGTLLRIEPTGVRHTVIADLSYPNGLTVDPNGYVYLTEHNAGRVRRIDPMTGDYTILASGMTNPNGITFNAVYNMLYVAEFSGEGTIYTMTLDAEGNAGPLKPWATEVGTGLLDGMGVDACGNLYICDYGYEGDSKVYRISPDGNDRELLIDGLPGGEDTRYLPNMQWGSGIGGWSPTAIYLPDGWNHLLYEVEIGVPAKPRVYP